MQKLWQEKREEIAEDTRARAMEIRQEFIDMRTGVFGELDRIDAEYFEEVPIC
jgi:hypothetical protein